MKNLSQNTINKIKENNFNFVKCYKIILFSGEVRTYTENDNDLIIDNLVYNCSSGINSYNDTFFNNSIESLSDIVGFIDTNDITEQDIIIGKFDNAEIEIFLIDKNDLNSEKIYIKKGILKNIKFVDNKFYGRIDGILSKLNKTITETYSPTCRASFCDKKCKLNKNDYLYNSNITIINDEFSFYSSGLANFDKDYFKYGVVIFTSGNNTNYKFEIKTSLNGNIILVNKPFFDLHLNDNFSILVGCDKTINSCANKFKNNLNFRGEPNIPRSNKIYKFY